MKTAEEFQKISEEIDVLIKNEDDKNAKLHPITDGIINYEKYANAKYKILWILKEPYYDKKDENGEITGGGWDIKNYNGKNKLNGVGGFNGHTFFPMLYISWVILNDFKETETKDMTKDIKANSKNMIDIFKCVAYINVKKIPGRTSSKPKVIENAYKLYRDILLKQLKEYNPDIIIFGGTFYHFSNDTELSLRSVETLQEGNLAYRIKDKQIFINAFHPAYRIGRTKLSKEQYCNDIINAVKKHQDIFK